MHVDDWAGFRNLLSHQTASVLMEQVKYVNGDEHAREPKRKKCLMFYEIVLGCQAARSPYPITQDCGGDEAHSGQHRQYQTSRVEHHAVNHH